MTEKLKKTKIDLQGLPFYRIPFMKKTMKEIFTTIVTDGSPLLKEKIGELEKMVKSYLKTTPVFGFSKEDHSEIRSFEISKLHQEIFNEFNNSRKQGFITEDQNLPNFLIIGSLYPTLKSVNELGKVDVEAKKCKFSTVLSNSDTLYEDLLIDSPTNKNVYLALNKTFMNRMFILSCTNSNGLGSWSKYSNGQSKPIDHTWSMFLLTIGIHPHYKLVQRSESEISEFSNSSLFKDIFLNSHDSIFKLFKEFKDTDLQNFERTQPISNRISKLIKDTFSEEEKNELGDQLDQNIYELSSVAKFLTINPNPSPNAYKLLGKLIDIYKATGINESTWALYEKGLRIPHHSAWSLILTSLDIHPIYKTVKRTDPKEIELANKIFKSLHNT